jgi:geranylgeranyl pyrophosphate synthase
MPASFEAQVRSGGCGLLRGAIAKAIRAWLAEHCDDPMEEMHRWALLPSGKLIRPLLLLESAVAVGGDYEAVLPAAVGTELAHVGSLIHDDIIDEDVVRRGRAAVHARFGPHYAIVGGDSLFFALFEELGECRRRGVPDAAVADAMEILSRAGWHVTSGAMREVGLSGWVELAAEDGPDVAGYVQMVRGKTAALMRAACQVGAVLGGGSREQADALAGYGEALGIAFQIRDDVLPYLGGEPRADKPAGSDLRNQRPALPLLLAARLGTAAQRRRLVELARGGAEAGDGMRQLVADTGALAEARTMAEDYLAECRRHLTVLPAGEHRDHLGQVADLVAVTGTDPLVEVCR